MKRSARQKNRQFWQLLTSRTFAPKQIILKPLPYTPSEKATCEKKRRYADEPLARAFAALMASNTDQGKLYVYRCKVCSGWHLTKRPNGTPATADDPFAKYAA